MGEEEGSKTIKYKLCRSCLEALKLAQTQPYIHSAVIVAMQRAQNMGRYIYPELDPVRRN